MRACQLLGGEQPEEALRCLRAAPDALAGTPELRVLSRLAERRCAAPGPWLPTLLAAWDDAGRPGPFTLLTDATSEELFEAAADASEDGDPAAFLDALIAQDEAFGSPLAALLAMGWKGHADSLALDAIRAVPLARSLDHRLLVVALLSSQLISPRVAPAARGARHAVLDLLATAHPRDFALVATRVLDDGAAPDAPLSPEQVDALAAAIARHEPVVTLGELYARLRTLRRAESSRDRAWCFTDAVALLPAPLLPLAARAQRSLQAADGPPRDALVALLLAVADAHRDASTLLDQLGAARLATLAAAHHPSTEVRTHADARLARVRAVARPDRRLPLSWPIEPLRREVIDAQASDEWGLLLRLAIDPGARP